MAEEIIGDPNLEHLKTLEERFSAYLSKYHSPVVSPTGKESRLHAMLQHAYAAGAFEVLMMLLLAYRRDTMDPTTRTSAFKHLFAGIVDATMESGKALGHEMDITFGEIH